MNMRSVPPGRDWNVDETKSFNENMYLRMQKDGDLEIINYKKDENGVNMFRVRWGGVSATTVFYTWEPESRLQLAVNNRGNKMIDEYFEHPVYLTS